MMRVAAVLAFLAALVATPALAQDKPAAKDSAAIEKCIKAKTATAMGLGKMHRPDFAAVLEATKVR